ncbi:MAG TPA: magnesium/cobalt transporter CorA [Candidatus Saccharimonadales bacterium]|nr:magnesium/cobalt transporter CorA [Candidatus Saccharimonadales bacterium]
MRTLFTADGHNREVAASELQQLLAAPHQVFWLDIQAPDADDYRLLSDTFKFHQLTIEDVKHQNQRPKLDGYDGYVFAVVFVIALTGDEVSFREHHLYIAPDYLVTVHLQPEPSFDKLNERIAESPQSACRKSSFLTYLVMDALVDRTFTALETLDEAVDKLQDEVLRNANNAQLALLQDMKHSAVEMRRILGAQRDMFQRLVTLSLEADRETTAYYRDVYDHIIRQYETVDSLRDLLTGAMDVYLSTVSNRLNMTVKALTVVASLFLPLTFLTGFFGMNFGWLVSRIGTGYAFIIGISLMTISILTQLVFFRRRGWI